MLDIKFIRENKELVKQNCVNRRIKVDIDKLLKLDEQRRENLTKTEQMRAERNQKTKGKPTPEEIIKLKNVGEEIKKLEISLEEIDKKYQEILLSIPNLTHSNSPIGGENDFKVLETKLSPPKFDFIPKNHEELLVGKNMLDFERGAKVAGSKFYFSKNKMVRLNLALINYGLDILEKNGFELLETPDMAKDEILEGIGFNPRGAETQVYSIENSDLSLVGTAEITVGGYHANEIIDLSEGPKKYAAISHCFRTEAGAYGKTSRGLYRVHQFTKLEMFVFCKPEDSEKIHQELLNMEKKIADGLEIPYRVIDIASGDLGGPAYRKFDIEAWMTMQGENGGYGEITSTSNCLDYQARRLNIKYKKENGENEFAHTLNGTAVVLSRFPITLVENHQTKNGEVVIPKKLRKYTGFKKM
jgi:seryl-tRNA synthetase